MPKPLFVQKYGGTSVGSIDRIDQASERVIEAVATGHQVLVVLSAMGDETDRLAGLSEAICKDDAPTREHDLLLATGEQVSVALLAMMLSKKGYPARSFTGGQAGIYTDEIHGQARIRRIDTQALLNCLKNGVIPVVAGFQGITESGEVTTLGRGGSDTTAMALAVALQAEECRIYTDVDGIYTADPRIVKEARLLAEITLEEMLEMASLGSKVLHPRAVALASKHQSKLRVLSSFRRSLGTLVRGEVLPDENEERGQSMEIPEISGIAATRDEAKLTVQHLQDRPGVACHVLGPVSEQNIDVDMIVQNVSEKGLTDLTFTVKKADYERAKALLADSYSVLGDPRVAKVSIVGIGMRSHAGIATKMFQALGDSNINIQMISTSEIKISVVIDEDQANSAVQALHKAFQLADEEAL